ncbi:MAG TPA: thioredoxin domain-containing protein [Kofleriaceae bacterium]|nr:thioredoxin domain-containing protein [Kofleriaceae bacterium]
MSKLALWVCIVAAAACTKNESRLDQVPGGGPGGGGMAAMPRPGASTGTGTVDDRLARLERKVDKIVGVLEQAMGPAQPDPNTMFSVPISPSDPVEGPADAKVTIVEAFEFMCPYCFLINPTVDQILAKYPKDVRVVGKYLLIHGQPAIAAASVACAANRQGKYPQVKHALWSTLFKLENEQPRVQAEMANLDALKKAAIDAGLDAAKLDADVKDPTCLSWLRESAQTLQPLGVNATPSFFINGKFVQVRSPEELDEAVKAAIAKADKAIADGVPQADYYQREIVAKGAKRVKGRFED